MIRWENNKLIAWFSTTEFNRAAQNKNHWSCFSVYSTPPDISWYEDYQMWPDGVPVKGYLDNFTSTLSDNATLYFNDRSTFPRTKIKLANYKRCIKIEKADYIVLSQKATIKDSNVEYVIISSNSDNYYGFTKKDFDEIFNGDLNNYLSCPVIKDKEKDNATILYVGYAKLIIDPDNGILSYNKGYYRKPFILDIDLDRIINQHLPDPTIDELVTLREMLQSPDSSIIKLASAMVGGYNISKWPLTFRVLLVTEPSWTHSYNGGNSVIVKQIKETLNITYASRSLNYITNYIQSKDEIYSLEDIKLAQELVRRIPEMKKWISRLQPFYLDTMPFVPDEYKN